MFVRSSFCCDLLSIIIRANSCLKGFKGNALRCDNSSHNSYSPSSSLSAPADIRSHKSSVLKPLDFACNRLLTSGTERRPSTERGEQRHLEAGGSLWSALCGLQIDENSDGSNEASKEQNKREIHLQGSWSNCFRMLWPWASKLRLDGFEKTSEERCGTNQQTDELRTCLLWMPQLLQQQYSPLHDKIVSMHPYSCTLQLISLHFCASKLIGVPCDRVSVRLQGVRKLF